MVRKIQQDEIESCYESLYRPYIQEIKQFGGGDGMSLPLLIYNICQDGIEFHIFEVNGEAVGFAIIERVKEELSQPMLFIVEFYVKRQYRRQGIGSEAFSQIYKNTTTPIFFVSLKRNIGATMFWDSMVQGWDILLPEKSQITFAGENKLYVVRRKIDA